MGAAGRVRKSDSVLDTAAEEVGVGFDEEPLVRSHTIDEYFSDFLELSARVTSAFIPAGLCAIATTVPSWRWVL